MSKLILEIKPNKGLGNISFGTITRDLITLLGDPNTVEEITNDDDLKTTILSYDFGLTVFVEGLVDPVVSHFDLDNKNATLFGAVVFDLDETAIIDLMKENGFSIIEKEEEEWGETRVTFDEAMMDFYFEDKKLVAVNWGVAVAEDGSIV